MARTKYEVNRDINNYESLKTQYNNMLDKLEDAAWYLNKSKEQIKVTKNKINNGFKINDSGADKGKINDIEANINSSLTRINNTLIPSAKNKINKIKVKLRSLYNELEGAS